MKIKNWFIAIPIIFITLVTVFLVLPSFIQISWLTDHIRVEISNNVTFSTFISILLTVVTVILAALALFIGIFAFVTIDRVKKEVENIAKEKAKEQVEKLIADSKENLLKGLNEKIDTYAANATRKEFNKVFSEESTQSELVSIIKEIVRQEIVSKSIREGQS